MFRLIVSGLSTEGMARQQSLPVVGGEEAVAVHDRFGRTTALQASDPRGSLIL